MRIIQGNDKPKPKDLRAAAVREVLAAREAEDKAKQHRAQTEAHLARILEEQELKSTSLEIGDTKYTTTISSNTTHHFNEPGLRKALSAKVFDRYTVKKLDTKRFKEAVEAGVLDAGTVAQYTETSYSKPFIRLTSSPVKREDDD